MIGFKVEGFYNGETFSGVIVDKYRNTSIKSTLDEYSVPIQEDMYIIENDKKVLISVKCSSVKKILNRNKK